MRSRAVIVGSLLGTALVSGGWLMQQGLHGKQGRGTYASARLLDAVMAHVQRDYVDSLPADSLYTKTANGLLLELNDPHSVLLTADRFARLEETTSGRYAGLGIRIDVRDGWITVVSPLPGTPATEAGLEAGDRIVQIAGQNTKGWTSDEASKALRGAPGSRVTIAVERPGMTGTLPFTITRREIHTSVVAHPMMLRDSIGYVDLTTFSETAAQEIRHAVDSLRQRGMRTLVFDLRGDPGGLLDQGVAVADLFLDRGQRIVSMKGRTPDAVREYDDRAAQSWPDLRLVVLVDSGSASAAEIVSGALQDHDRAVLLGTTSYGKGSAQSLFPVVGGGALKLTTALWYTPSGRSINRRHASADDDASDDDAARVTPDTGASAPRFKTDDGRTVLGGGGITPDIVVADTALDAKAHQLETAVGKQVPAFRDVLSDYALELKGAHAVTSPDFVVTPAMRDALRARLAKRQIDIPAATWAAASPVVDRLLGQYVTRYAFGDAAAFARGLRDDPTLAAALQLANGARTQRELLDRAAERAPKR